MKLPLSWLNDYIEIEMNDLEGLAKTFTMIGLEVDEIRLVGLPMPEGDRHEFKITGLSWPEDKFVVAQIDEVMPHPNAERLTLCRLNDGVQEHTVLTGAPSLLQHRDKGPLPEPFKVAYARQGARLYDGHKPGWEMTIIKPVKIRGVVSSSMACSEKELGISEEHEDIIYLDDDAPTGTPLVEYMGDGVFEIETLPNMIRNACILGMARELSAATGKPLKMPELKLKADGESITGKASIKIEDPELNPRFVLGLVRDVEPRPSPYWVQRRLNLAGMRPINSIVDATNYVMLTVGEPLHAFDYDILIERAGGKPPTIITRTAEPGEKLTTLDGVERTMDDFSVLVTDTGGPLSIAGVMGGAESEVHEGTKNVLLEGAAWNFINIRRTTASQRLSSEASYRFSRGVHPELSRQGVQLGLDHIAQWSGGQIAASLVDEYPQPVEDPVVTLTIEYVNQFLGIDISANEAADILRRLDFECTVDGSTITARTPPYRLDINTGVTGQADIIEEIARIYGYDNIPATRLADMLPPQRNVPLNDGMEQLRDALVNLGLQEVISYRLTHPGREVRLLPPELQIGKPEYVRLKNPIAPERSAMRRSLLASVMEIMETNSRLKERLALFEIGPVFIPLTDQELPDEPLHLAIALRGPREHAGWKESETEIMDFYDLKGILEAVLELHHVNASFQLEENPTFHPGKCASIVLGDSTIGVFGELHPLVKENFDLGIHPVLAAEIEISYFTGEQPILRETKPVPLYPPILEDIAVIVDEDVPAVRVEETIVKGGSSRLTGVRLFDIYRGEQVGEGKKSLAYSLTYQAPDRTLTDKDAARIRKKIVLRLAKELGAKLRS